MKKISLVELNNAIGSIDEKYLAEAENYKPSASLRRRKLALTLIAAALMTAAIAVLSIGNYIGRIGADTASGDDDTSTPSVTEPPVTLPPETTPPAEEFIIEDGVLVSYLGISDTVDIPEGVVTIGASAFASTPDIKIINLSSTVENFEENCLAACPQLKSINPAEGGVLQYTDYVLLSYNRVEYISPDYPYSHFAFPEGCISSGVALFANTPGITSVTIPESLTFIPAGSFKGSSVSQIYYDGTSYQFSLIAIQDKNLLSESGELLIPVAMLKSDYEYPFLIYKSNGDGTCTVTTERASDAVGVIYIPEYSPQGDRVTAIDSFGHAMITEIHLPESITEIPDNCFYYCTELEKITMPGVTSIGRYAFEGCAALCKIDLSSVRAMMYNAFSGCAALTEVTLCDELSELPGRAFLNCTSLAKVTLPKSLKSISGEAFNGCASLSDIALPDTLTSIGVEAFSGCSSLINVTLPAKLESIERKSFAFCGIKEILLPDSLLSIGNKAFEGCTSLVSVRGGNSLVEFNGFSGCTALTEVILGENVSTLSGLDGCTALKSVAFNEKIEYIGSDAFRGCTSITEIDIPETVTSIGGSAFADCVNLKRISIPDGVYAIRGGAFSGCKSLTGISLPSTVQSLDAYAFSGCTALESIDVPVCYMIGQSAFMNCTSLRSVTVAEGTLQIYSSAFLGCTALESFIIPESITEIKGSLFEGCTSLKAISIPDSVTSIGVNAFKGCTSLAEVKFGKGLTELREGAFNGCTSLTSVVLPDALKAITDVFNGCSSLESVEFGTATVSVWCLQFEGCTSLRSITLGTSVRSIMLNDAFLSLPSFECFYYKGTAQDKKSISFYSTSVIGNTISSKKINEPSSLRWVFAGD